MTEATTPAAPPVPVLCPVRGCGRPLGLGARAAVCPAGHSFDRARSGYWNLLQPQDRRARAPGDAAAVVEARRRSLGRGLGAALRDEVVSGLRARGLPPGAAVLDAGCGGGFFLQALTAQLGVAGVGVDISAAAVNAAARAWPEGLFIVANADRALPFGAGAFAAILSLTGPKNAAEFHRLLAPGGWLVVAVPGADDLAEVREVLHGAATRDDRGGRIARLFAAEFEPSASTTARLAARLDAAGVADLLAGAYRGARHRERARLAGVAELTVTVSYQILWLRPRPAVL
jgi:23S rRNA (guanine745-N1)-methyltransferase